MGEGREGFRPAEDQLKYDAEKCEAFSDNIAL